MAAHRLAKPADQPAPRPVWHAWVCRAELARSRVAPCARRRHSALGLPSPAVAAHTLPAVPTAFDLAAVLRHSLADRRLAGRPQLRHPSVRQVDLRLPLRPTAFPAHPQTRSARSAICRRPRLLSKQAASTTPQSAIVVRRTRSAASDHSCAGPSASDMPTIVTLNPACHIIEKSTSAQTAGPVLPWSINSIALNQRIQR